MRSVTILTSLLSGFLFLRLASDGDSAAVHVPLVFLVLPVALWAIMLGLQGGLSAAAAGSALIVFGSDLSWLDSLLYAAMLLLLGGLVGRFAAERRRVVAEVARREELSLDLVATAGYDGWFRSVNPAFTRVLGYTEAELLSRPFVDFIHPDDRPSTFTDLAEQIETGQELVGVLNRFRVKDGFQASHVAPDHTPSYRHIEWNVRVDKQAKALISFGRDVTDRVEAKTQDELRLRELEQALDNSRESNLRLNSVAEAVLDGLVTVDEHSTILRFNTSSERIFGYPRVEVIGRNVSVLLPRPARRRSEPIVDRFVRTGEEGLMGVRHEIEGRRKDGSVFPMELAVSEVPLRSGRIFIGVVRDVTERRQRAEAERHYQLILEQTVQARTAELQDRTAELDEARVETLRKLALAAEYRDDQTFEHAERVGRTAALLGERLGLAAREVERLRQAAPLHDIGKLAVPDTILLKPGGLTPEEWQEMTYHTTAGGSLLADSSSDVLSLAAEIALAHHEWWDGTGYPAGLSGEAIPLHGRIVCLADVYDALTHERSYKAAWPVEEAVAEIARLRCRQFDPAVVDAFEQLDPYGLADRPRDTAAPLRAIA